MPFVDASLPFPLLSLPAEDELDEADIPGFNSTALVRPCAVLCCAVLCLEGLDLGWVGL